MMEIFLLTARQASILGFIGRHRRKHGYSPTIREIGAEFGIAGPNGVRCHLFALRSKGLLTWEPGGAARTLRPTRRFIPASEL